jgi:hypothetical protein
LVKPNVGLIRAWYVTGKTPTWIQEKTGLKLNQVHHIIYKWDGYQPRKQRPKQTRAEEPEGVEEETHSQPGLELLIAEARRSSSTVATNSRFGEAIRTEHR